MVNFIFKLFIIFLCFIQTTVESRIDNKILMKVDNKIITNYDLKKEIKTLLIINNIELNDANFTRSKKIAIDSLVSRNIKKSEIEKYKINKYNPKELDSYIQSLAKSQNISVLELKNKFSQNNLDYDNFIENLKVGYIWNTLIFELYKNQISINSIEVDNELKKIYEEKKIIEKYNISELVLQDSKNIEDKIKNIFNYINNNGFEIAVKEFSIAESSLNQGKIGWVNESEIQNVYLQELRKIKVGQITQPIKKNNKLIILKLNDLKKEQNIVKNVDELKKSIINQNKSKKLNLFSRSHLTKIEKTILIEKYE